MSPVKSSSIASSDSQASSQVGKRMMMVHDYDCRDDDCGDDGDDDDDINSAHPRQC